MSPSVLWPALLGTSALVAGIASHRRELGARSVRDPLGIAALGPAFVAAALAAFAGEHFTAAAVLAKMVPRLLPGSLFIAYFVGAAHLAAAVSFVSKRYVRWSAFWLFVMFALFVLLMDLPGAIAQPASRMGWILAARETTFAIGALAIFAFVIRGDSPSLARQLATIARFWTAGVLIYYGIDHLSHPQYTPGVPSGLVAAAWVPFPHALAYAVGALLVAFGIAMFTERFAGAAASLGGALMAILTLALYVPKFFGASTAPEQVVGINYVFDTLLFAGTLLVIARAIGATVAPAGAPAAVRVAEYQPS